MIERKTELEKKIDELLEVKRFYRDKLKQSNMVIPHIFINTSSISEYDESRVYEAISEKLSDNHNNKVYEYEVNDEPVKTQIRNIVYALSEKVRYKACYDGMVAIKLTRDFIKRKENSLLLEFLKEQEWYLIFSARENIVEIFDWVSTRLFVDEVIKILAEDLSYKSPMESLREYEINLNSKLASELNGYMTNIRNNPSYNYKSESVAVNAIAYNAMKFAIRAQGDRSRKIRGVEELTEGINEKAMAAEHKVQMGFQVDSTEKGVR